MSDEVREWIKEVVERTVVQFTLEDYPEEWDLEGLVKQMDALYEQPKDEPITVDELREDSAALSRETLIEDFQEEALERYGAKEEELGPELVRELERFVILQVVDQRWREHLDAMDYMREGVHLRAMAQKDPLVEYQHEGHLMFAELGAAIHDEVVLTLFHAQLAPEEADELQRAQQAAAVNGGGLQYAHDSLAGAEAIAAAGGGAPLTTTTGATSTMAMSGGSTSTAGAPRPIVKTDRENIGRNEPCWCGSGKKFKKCHGA
jgi:preprotein translocase subunit SecA